MTPYPVVEQDATKPLNARWVCDRRARVPRRSSIAATGWFRGLLTTAVVKINAGPSNVGRPVAEALIAPSPWCRDATAPCRLERAVRAFYDPAKAMPVVGGFRMCLVTSWIAQARSVLQRRLYRGPVPSRSNIE